MPAKPAKGRKPKRVIRPELKYRLRIMRGDDNAFGPGKAELLQHLEETGSLSQAAVRMKMSYMKAWLLVKAMNRNFASPLVRLTRGGARGGGATITSRGKDTVACYKEMCTASEDAIQPSWRKLQRLLKR